MDCWLKSEVNVVFSTNKCWLLQDTAMTDLFCEKNTPNISSESHLTCVCVLKKKFVDLT